MRQFSVMIKPASSICNMRCKYCFYEDVTSSRENKSFGMMQEETLKIMIHNIYKDLIEGDYITIAFQGGEPMLVGIQFYIYLINEVSKWEKTINVSYALQTNGTIIDDQWAKFFKENNFLLGISLDLLKEQHNETRAYENGTGTWDKVLNSIKILNEHKVDFNILCTLTNSIARHPKKVWNQIQKLNFKYIQFTPCLDDLVSDNNNVYALTPERFSRFYEELFGFWFDNFKKGDYISIKFFDDLVNLIMTGVPSGCGMNGICQPQIVIESDGSVYPCDFYCLDEYCIGNIKEVGLITLYQLSLKSDCKKRDELPTLCKTCKYFRICGGNCKRMQKQICCMPSDKICWYSKFLDTCINDLILIANQQMEKI